MEPTLSLIKTQSLNHQNELQNLIKSFNTSPPLPKKLQQKKQLILFRLPLFMTIYQKKGDQNFSQIVDSIKLFRFEYGEVILSSQSLSDEKDNDEQQNNQRTFNYILKGSVMLFIVKGRKPQFYKKLGPNEYFGQKINFGQDKLYQVKALSTCFILQLDINVFYNTFSGHFQYTQLKDKVNFLQQIWIFSDMRRSYIQKILLMSQNIKYKKNTVLFQKGSPAQKIYVIVSGQLALYEIQQNQKVKFVPFCLLSRSQIFGLEEIALQKNYECNGIVTSQFLQVMIMRKQIYENFLSGYVSDRQQQIKKIYASKQRLKSMGIKYDKEYKQVAQYSKKRQEDLFKIFTAGFMKIIKNPKIQMQKLELSHQQQLKNPQMRQFKLKEIKVNELKKYNDSSLSTLTNNHYTKDKNILINYLMKKQKARRKIHQIQFRYQRSLSSMSGIVKSIHVDSSKAVKYHKRKLLKSRYKSLISISK